MSAEIIDDSHERMERMPEATEVKVSLIAPDGLGFGEGAISFKARTETEINQEEVDNIVEVITSPDKILVEIDQEDGEYLDDDGCGDGRGVTNESGEVVYIKQGDNQYKKSLNRAKLFGGGATMAMAAEIAVSEIRPDNLTVVFQSAMDMLDDNDIDYGAHTDESSGEIKSGCGAIDNAPKIIANAVKYQKPISDTIRALVPDVDAMVLDEVIECYESFLDEIGDDTYSGQQIMDAIDEREKVIKQLVKGHQEMFVVLNDVENYTVNQYTVRDASKESIQVFAVDLWRLHSINDRIYEDDEIRDKAFVSQLVYTLATAATLTDGTLPIFQIKKSERSASSYL